MIWRKNPIWPGESAFAAESRLRREVPLAEDRGKVAVVVLHELHVCIGELELARLAHVRRQQLERLHDKVAEGVDEHGVLLLVVDGIQALAAPAAGCVELGEVAHRKEAHRVRNAVLDAVAALGAVGAHRGDVRVVAPLGVFGAHVRRRLAFLPVLVGDAVDRLKGVSLALVGELVEDRPHLVSHFLGVRLCFPGPCGPPLYLHAMRRKVTTFPLAYGRRAAAGARPSEDADRTSSPGPSRRTTAIAFP